MRLLCALGARDGAQLVTRALTYLPREHVELVLLFVIDEGPRHGLERLRGPLGRGPRLGGARQAQMAAAEARSVEEVLAEAGAAAAQAGVAATTELLRGQSERVIVERAEALRADLIVVGAREGIREKLLPGPHSIGHVARFVVDHAPCDVLLVRSS
jgi:nucleotide-binding universal stress UspA family protein